ncbi:DUF805 domain-containing protein [Desulfovibrio sulfodismutans]|uniref:DUF805 domain-containing protein n=1 Tax=Desulfolutivibrio sulfodismutans TaxID=63561 RepID=A0A7K3NGS7_9BACT|nr:DUF805 domain-containing protein [Desulfolutivibrio sulfodismutans]NDY55401.1 DUF805 domain-containing protein [Desulfolutivibrio sulfodismutans]QLA12224.1 DUF805 domain-containing protein [Desulfolutivibrio sulfodismutans DSM 3696]
MDFMTSLSTCLRKYATFSGRASRAEFWYFTLAVWLLSILAMVLDQALFGSGSTENSIMPLTSVFQVVVFLPVLSVSVRRLHDVNRSGWWYLIALTGVGFLLLLYWFVKKGADGENAYSLAVA